MVIGYIIYAVSILLLTLFCIYPIYVSFKNEVNFALSIMSVVFYIIPIITAYIGQNMIQFSYRAYILDSFDGDLQNRVNITHSFMNGLSWFVQNLIMLMMEIGIFYTCGKDQSTHDDILRANQIRAIVAVSWNMLTIISMGLVVYLFCKIATENMFMCEPLTFNNSISYIKETKKSITHETFSVLIVIFFGWLCWYPFDSRRLNISERFVFVQKNQVNLRYLVEKIYNLSFGFVQIVTCIILYKVNRNIHISMIVSFAICGVMNCFFFFVKVPEEGDSPWKNIICTFIPFIFSSLIFTHIDSYPFALVRKLVDTDKYGSFIGIANGTITLSQLLSNLMYFVIGIESNEITLSFGLDHSESDEIIKTSNTQTTILHFFSVLCLVTCGVSFILTWIEEEAGDNYRAIFGNEKEMDDSDEDEELFNEQTSIRSMHSEDDDK